MQPLPTVVTQIARNVVDTFERFGGEDNAQRGTPKVIEPYGIAKHDLFKGWIIPSVSKLNGCNVDNIRSITAQADLVLGHIVVRDFKCSQSAPTKVGVQHDTRAVIAPAIT